MSFADVMATDAANVFLNTDDFAATITWRPLGVVASGQSITAIVDRSSPPAVIPEVFGQQLKDILTIEIAATYSITAHDQGRPRDTFVIDSVVWGAKRIAGIDSGMQSIELEKQNASGSPPT